jgi:hypothetical protein
MARSKNSSGKTFTIRPEMFIAVFAVIISMSTLVVYIYQSNLMKQQQKMAVWPYLIYGPSWGEDYLIINLTNKGIGPAIIKEVRCSFEGQALDDLHWIMTYVPDSLKAPYRYSSVWAGQVLMAGENLEILSVRAPKTVAYLLDVFRNRNIEFEICYASVYGDTWISYGMDVKEGRCGD